MTWNYRIVKYKDSNGFGLHEVYYDDKNEPWAMTKNPTSFACDLEEGKEGVVSSVCRALTDALTRPVLEEFEEGEWPGKEPRHHDTLRR